MEEEEESYGSKQRQINVSSFQWCFLLLTITVVVCLYTEKYLIKTRIRWPNLYCILTQFQIQILDDVSEVNLHATLSHVPILTLTLNTEVVKGVHINSLTVSALGNCAPSFHVPVKIKILSHHHPLNAFSIYREYIRMILRILNLSS